MNRKSIQKEIAKTFNIPYHKLKDLNIPSRTDMEREEKKFFELCIIPWVEQYISLLKINKPDNLM